MNIDFERMLLKLSLESANRHFGEVKDIFEDQAARVQQRIEQYEKENPPAKKTKKVTKKTKKRKK